MQQGPAEFGETDITPTRDDVIGEAHNVLLIGFMADFRPTQHDLDLRSLRFEQAHQGAGLRDVPDVHTQTDDLRVLRQQFVGNFLRLTGNGELTQCRLRPQLPHVRQQIPQTQRRMDVFGIERTKKDGDSRVHSVCRSACNYRKG